MYIKLIGVLAIEERHRRASLWAQPSVSETDTPNLAPVPSTQPQNSPLNPSVANVNPSPIASSQCQATTTDTPNLAPVPTSSPQPQNSPADPLIANVNPSTIASSQYQATTTDIPNLAPVPTSRRPVSSPQPQNSPADPLIVNVSLSPVTSSQRQATTTVVTSLEFQTTPSTLSIANVNPSPVTSSQRQATTTAVTSLQFQTTPSTLTSPQSTSAFYYHPTMLQSGVEFPKPNSPLTEFLESTSPSGLYAWDNNMSTSSNSFDFSGMNSPQQLTLDAGPIFGMDQYWNSPQASLFSTMAPTPMLNTMATPLHPDLEVSVHQNIPMSIATTDFILPNYATPQNNLTPSNSIPPNCAAPRNNLTSATNHLILPNSAVMAGRGITLYQTIRFKERIQCIGPSEFTGPRESVNVIPNWEECITGNYWAYYTHRVALGDAAHDAGTKLLPRKCRISTMPVSIGMSENPGNRICAIFLPPQYSC